MQKLKWYQVQTKLQDLERSVFTVEDLTAIFGVKRRSAQAFLSYNQRAGKIKRIKRGYYFFGHGLTDPFYAANILYAPSYLSMETALSFYSIIPETVYAITSITTKPSREINFENYNFVYQTIKRETFTGYVLQKNFLIATPEKALADYCYFVSLGKKSINDRIDISRIDKALFLEYLKLFKSKKTRRVAKNWLKI
ncbi:MAG: type IV toxin-antitoxin system AbiEi family antitoxin domain-containing protein [Patescibacteria group bacterium]